MFALDLAHDPSELAPLPDDSDLRRRGLAELERAIDEARRAAREHDLAPRHITLDDAVRDALRGAGYTSSGNDPDAPR